MTLVLLLFIAGTFLIAAEVILPGGIVGLLGGGLIVGGIVAAYSEFGISGAVIGSAVALLLLIAALYIEFKILPKTRFGKGMFMDESIEGKTTYSKADDSAVGQIGETATALGPTGFVLVNGTKFEATSRSGFIDKHERVKVTGRDNFRIIVSKI